MRYVEARIYEYNREEAYRIYVTESLRLAPQNSYLTGHYLDMADGKKKEEPKSGDDIVKDIMAKGGLRFG